VDAQDVSPSSGPADVGDSGTAAAPRHGPQRPQDSLASHGSVCPADSRRAALFANAATALKCLPADTSSSAQARPASARYRMASSSSSPSSRPPSSSPQAVRSGSS
jgi:hypothetical protein